MGEADSPGGKRKGPPLTEEQRRIRRKEINRESARRIRRRKNNETENLKHQARPCLAWNSFHCCAQSHAPPGCFCSLYRMMQSQIRLHGAAMDKGRPRHCMFRALANRPASVMTETIWQT